MLISTLPSHSLSADDVDITLLPSSCRRFRHFQPRCLDAASRHVSFSMPTCLRLDCLVTLLECRCHSEPRDAIAECRMGDLPSFHASVTSYQHRAYNGVTGFVIIPSGSSSEWSRHADWAMFSSAPDFREVDGVTEPLDNHR